MPTVFGIPIIGFIQMVIGAAIVLFVLVKFLGRPKNKKNSFIIKNVHIITGDGTEAFNQNVYVSKGIIEEISAEPIVKKGVQIIDGEGKTLMPGLIDSHVHIQGMNSRSEEDSDRFLAEKIPEIFAEGVFPYGVTTIKDMCAPRHFAYKLRDMLRKGKITGPELLIVGPNFTTPGGHPANTLGGDNPWMRKEMAIEVISGEDVTSGVAELKKAGVDFLKMTYQGGDYLYFNNIVPLKKLDRERMRQIISEGKKNGLNTTAHVFYKDDVRELLEAGIYGIEHGILDEALSADDDILKLWKNSGARFVPTVNAMTYENDPNRLTNSIHNLKLIYDAGIPVAMGTDTMLEAGTEESVQRELEYYVEAGLTPMQAIVLATKNGAEHLGIADRKGLVKMGMEADFILLDKNPSEDISNIRLINRVFAKGKTVYSQSAIASYDIPDYCYPEDVSEIELTADDGTERKVDVAEMEDAAKKCGFVVAAAVAAVAQHSIIPQYAAGRPESADEKQLERFAQQIADKTGTAAFIPGNRPYKKAGAGGLVPKPTKDCIKCGICANSCPVQAIDPVKFTADSKKCISCMRCVKKCSNNARKVNGAMVSVAALAIKKACSVRKENELFL